MRKYDVVAVALACLAMAAVAVPLRASRAEPPGQEMRDIQKRLDALERERGIRRDDEIARQLWYGAARIGGVGASPLFPPPAADR